MAIDDLLDEHEQSERVRSWLRGNALGLIAGVSLGVAGIVGWHWWKDAQAERSADASARYSEAVRMFGSGALPTDKGRATISRVSEANSTLGAMAALQLAKAQVEAGKRDDAIVTLRSQIGLHPAMQAVVNERLARLLIDAGKGKEALPLVEDERDPAMLAIRGDAQFALGDRSKAREAYAKALGLVDVADPQYRLLQLKLIEAGGTLPHTEDRT